MSEGEFVDVRPFNPNKKGQRISTRQAIPTMPSTGRSKMFLQYERVGVFGISYPGFYSTMAALSGPSRIKSGIAAGPRNRLVPGR